jgi:hypothetical protein
MFIKLRCMFSEIFFFTLLTILSTNFTHDLQEKMQLKSPMKTKAIIVSEMPVLSFNVLLRTAVFTIYLYVQQRTKAGLSVI